MKPLKLELTGPDQILSRYLELTAEIKRLTTELDSIKADLKLKGSYSTQHYVCVVSETQRTVGPDAKTLKQELGEDRYEELSHTITYKSVKVSKKGN